MISCNYDKTQQLKILANVLKDTKLFEEAVIQLQIEDFDLPVYQIIWEVVLNYHKQYKQLIPLNILPDELKLTLDEHYGPIETLIMPEDISHLIEALTQIATEPVNYPYYSTQLPLFIKSVRMAKLMSQAEQAKSVADQADIMNKISKLKELTTTTRSTLSYVGETPELLDDDSDEERVPTGSRLLDSRIDGGLGRGELGMVTACPGVGKTTTLINFAHGAILSGYYPLFITLEVQAKLIKRRYISMASGISARWIKKHSSTWPPYIKKRFEKTISCPFLSHLAINDLSQGAKTLQAIKKSIIDWQSHMREKFGDKVPAFAVYIDHFDRIEIPENFTRTRKNARSDEQLTAISESLSDMARELNVAIWTATQGTRDATNKQILNMGHTSGAFHKNDPLTVALGLGLKRMMDSEEVILDPYEEYIDEDADVMGEDLVFSLTKNRNNPNTYFFLYRGPTLKYWDRVEDCAIEQSYLESHVDASSGDWHSKLYSTPIKRRK